jgi:hypothetical protein
LRNLLLDYPSYPSWVRLYLFAAAVEQDDVEEQRLQVAVSDRQDSPFVILGRLAFHVMAKNDVAGEEAYRRLSRVEQTMADNPASVLMRLRLRGPKMQAIVRRLDAPH